MVSITVSTPGKPTLSLDFPNKHPDQVLIKEVKAAIHAKFPKVRGHRCGREKSSADGCQLVANRQRLTSPQTEGKPVPLTDDKASLGSYGVGQGATLRLKDLGAQVPYRLLYVCEYVSFRLHIRHRTWLSRADWRRICESGHAALVPPLVGILPAFPASNVSSSRSSVAARTDAAEPCGTSS